MHYQKELTTRSMNDLRLMAEQLVPPYMVSYWENAFEKYSLDEMRGIAEVLFALHQGNSWKARRIILDDYIEAGFITGAIAMFSYEGNMAARKAYQIEYGKPNEHNVEYFDKYLKYHNTKGVEYYRNSALEGNPASQRMMGVIYEQGRGVDSNPYEAMNWYRKSAENGDAEGMDYVGRCYINGYGTSQDYSSGFYWFSHGAEKGDKLAQYELGVCYQCGYGVEKNMQQAVSWYQKSADQGCALAMNELAGLYYNGEVVPRDNNKAFAYYQAAAQGGLDSAQCTLGWCYREGVLTEKNPYESAYWYKECADSDYVYGQSNIAHCYQNGIGVGKDVSKAFSYYLKAAEQGDAFSQNEVGRCYQSGIGTTRSDSTALEWFVRSADAGNADAQGSAGAIYLNGAGTAIDYTKAVKYLQMGAAQANHAAECDLGFCYDRGYGVPQNSAEAFRLFKLSADGGNQFGQCNVAVYYEIGTFVGKNLDMAISYYTLAANQGNQMAQQSLQRLKSTDSGAGSVSQEKKNYTGEESGQQLSSGNSFENNNQTVDSLLAELNGMVGLAGVKKEVQNRINRIRITQKAGRMGSKRVFSSGSLHMVFTGNPGTGKTTVARLIGKLYGAMGVIKNGDVFVECGRDDLVSKNIGETSELMKKKIEAARGGILFIDEAYSLYKKDASWDFGQEAVDTLVQYMETMRDELVVILAGYQKEMAEFIRNANPGLASRFRTTIHFDDYSVPEMTEIFYGMVARNGMTVDEQAKEYVERLIREKSRMPGFGNARGVRNLFEDVIEAHDNVLADKADQGIEISTKEIECITEDDIKSMIDVDEDLDVEGLLAQLDSLIGLASVKRQVRTQVAIVQICLNAQKAGVKNVAGIGSQNMVFAGNPGTGKTTVARIIGKIYQKLGLVADGNRFVECGRSDLIGQYIGQTAPKVKGKVDEALGGILFIDEAYSLYQEGAGNDFGAEAISTLVQEMENHREDLIVIMAGYSAEMQTMISRSNAGLRSRVPIWIEFEDYSVPELCQIFEYMVRKNGYALEAGVAGLVEQVLRKHSAKEDFGNARGVRNLVDQTIANQSVRLVSMGFAQIQDASAYTMICKEDIEKLIEVSGNDDSPRRIGF